MMNRTTASSLSEVNPRLDNIKASNLYRRYARRTHKRLIRYGLLGANLLVLGAAVLFVIRNPNTSQTVQQSISNDSATAAANPLDQLSSADIAVNVARLTNMAEATSVKNYAESFNAQLAIAPADNTVVAKPQIVATSLKSRKDIITYTTQAGDTVSSLATKFGVTSNTIRWSNNLDNSDTIPAGKQIFVLPGVNGVIYTVAAGDTADSLAKRFQANRDQIVEYNDAETGGLPVGKKVIIPDGMQMVQTTRTTAPSFAFGFAATYGYNGYDYGWCTWYAANRRAELGSPVPSNLGNAYSWYYLAQQAGLPTGLTPQVGAVAVNVAGNHVMIVEQVNSDGSFWVSEMNSHGQVSITDSTPAGGWARRDYKFFSSAGNLKFIY